MSLRNQNIQIEEIVYSPIETNQKKNKKRIFHSHSPSNFISYPFLLYFFGWQKSVVITESMKGNLPKHELYHKGYACENVKPFMRTIKLYHADKAHPKVELCNILYLIFFLFMVGIHKQCHSL